MNSLFSFSARQRNRVGAEETSGDRGFSIIELIIVLVIIAILASIAIVSYSWMRDDAADAKMEATVSNIKKAILLKLTKTGKLSPTTNPQTRQALLEEYKLSELADDVWVMEDGSRNCTRNTYDFCSTEGWGTIDIKHKPLVIIESNTQFGNPTVRIIGYSAVEKGYIIETIHADGLSDRHKATSGQNIDYVGYNGYYDGCSSNLNYDIIGNSNGIISQGLGGSGVACD